jgi:uncharacterized protein (TIRG00374 family)
MSVKQWLRVISGIALAALFLWLLTRQIRMDDMQRALVGVQPAWIVAAVIAFSAGYACRIARWRSMLVLDSTAVTWFACAGPLLASFAVNNLMPFRAGDVLRSLAFNRQLGTTYGVTIATLFVERLLDLLILLAGFGAALLWFEMTATRLAHISGGGLVGGTLLALLVLMRPHYLAPLGHLLGRISARWLPRFGRQLSGEIDRSLSTLQHLARGTTLRKLLLWSVLAWVAEGCVFWFVALALPSIIEPTAAWLALPIGTLATLLPSTPGYIGTFDYFTAGAMTQLGNAASAAAVYALLLHALLWLPVTLAGGLYLLVHPLSRWQAVRS